MIEHLEDKAVRRLMEGAVATAEKQEQESAREEDPQKDPGVSSRKQIHI